MGRMIKECYYCNLVKPTHGWGLCGSCYIGLRTNPDYMPKHKRPEKKCKICGGKYWAKDLCKNHYEQTPEAKARTKRSKAKPENKERHRIRLKKYYKKNRDTLLLKMRERYRNLTPEQKEKEKIRSQERNKNGEYKEYHHKNKDVRNKESKKWHMKNPDYRSNWQKENPKKCLENSLRHLKNAAKPFELSISGYKLALKIWHDVIEKRDIVCQMCGGNQKLEAHHLLYRANYPLLSFNENNGILLCRMCHYHTHGKKLISTE